MKSEFFNTEWHDLSKSGKTTIYKIVSKVSKTILGYIKWHAPWRKYCFFPEPDMLFDHKCLKDLAIQCKELTDIKKSVKGSKASDHRASDPNDRPAKVCREFRESLHPTGK